MNSDPNDTFAISNRPLKQKSRKCYKQMEEKRSLRITRALSDFDTEDRSKEVRRKPMSSPQSTDVHKGKSVSPAVFDYFEFHRYLQLKEEYQRRVRWCNLACGVPNVPVQNFTTDVLEKELREIFGPLCLQSQDGRCFFNSYKDGRLQLIRMWIKQETNPSKPLDYAECLSAMNDILEVLNGEYTSAHIDLYNQDVFRNNHKYEYFVLPRPNRTVKNYYLMQKNALEKLRNQNVNNIILEGLDLRIFDPRFQTDAVMPNCNDIPVTNSLCEKLSKLMEQYPLGIPSQNIPLVWEAENKYSIDISQYGVANFFEFLSKIPDIVWLDTETPSLNLVFPAYLKDHVCKLEDLYQRVWNRILFLLEEFDGKLHVKNIASVAEAYFEIDIRCYCNLISAFLKPQFHKNTSKTVCLDFDTASNSYLCYESSLQNKSQNQVLQPTTISEKSTIPQNYVRRQDKARWLSKYITSGTDLHCTGANVSSLNRFYVNAVGFQEEFKILMTTLNEEYMNEAILEEATADRTCLTKGLYVAVAYHSENYRCRKQYYRGLILRVLCRNGNIKYKVFLIDYGYVTYSTIEEIKYLKKDYLKSLPAQAIECGVLLNSNYDGYYKKFYRWSTEEVRLFREALWNNLGVSFIKTSSEKTYCNLGRKFLVSITVVVLEEGKMNKYLGTLLEKVEQKIIAHVQGRYIETVVDKRKDCGSATEGEKSCKSVDSEELSWSSMSEKDSSKESEPSDEEYVQDYNSRITKKLEASNTIAKTLNKKAVSANEKVKSWDCGNVGKGSCHVKMDDLSYGTKATKTPGRNVKETKKISGLESVTNDPITKEHEAYKPNVNQAPEFPTDKLPKKAREIKKIVPLEPIPKIRKAVRLEEIFENININGIQESDKLTTSVGSSCKITDHTNKENPREANKIVTLEQDSSNIEVGFKLEDISSENNDTKTGGNIKEVSRISGLESVHSAKSFKVKEADEPTPSADQKTAVSATNELPLLKNKKPREIKKVVTLEPEKNTSIVVKLQEIVSINGPLEIDKGSSIESSSCKTDADSLNKRNPGKVKTIVSLKPWYEKAKVVTKKDVKQKDEETTTQSLPPATFLQTWF